MKTLQENANKMYTYITQTMKANEWYPIKTDEAYDAITYLMDLFAIPDCILSDDELRVKKRQIDFTL